ncbi:MAG: hypothetical protein JXB49_00765 [Bacteroidales bacterium]|nr:hypothetical protein [Bacteroidales bacterium]
MNAGFVNIRIFGFCIFFFYYLPGFGQESKQIEIINSNTIEYDEALGPDMQKLIGDVQFEHNTYTMTCDSAYFSSKQVVDAFGRVHINQGDTLHLYGDYLKYTGEIKLAEVRDNVRLIKRDMYLETRFLDFDMNEDIGYYFNGGKIYNGDNTLKSSRGYYYSKEDLFYFRDTVVIKNAQYDIYSDTLKYNTITKVAHFLGPTEIVGKEDFIYCENGWYNTETNISQFDKNAYLLSGSQYLKGDSLYYERDNGLGKAFKNVVLIDTSENVILKGDYGYYLEEPYYALMTQKALFMQFQDGDTLFMHADTIVSDMDTSDVKIINAYHKVKVYRFDLQGKCDSMSYSFADSIIKLYINPVIWSEQHQLTANYIEIHTKNNVVDEVQLYAASFIVAMEDSIRFNQIKGKNMVGYFRDNELYKVYVTGNGQTIYFPKDEEELIGVNKAESTDLIIYFKENKPDKIYFLNNPVATLYPPDDLPKADLYLNNFRWLDKYRPKSKEDIFVWIE